MKHFAGKTAFITGGAGGIGFAMAGAFGRRGMKVAIADVEADTCAKAVDALKADGINAIGMPCDVSDREQYAKAAERTLAEFGKVCTSSATMPACRAPGRSRPSRRPTGTG
jgi:NAD(P)-dependent dehydrogenase (short-subunit alcohol dehydrogenase family)